MANVLKEMGKPLFFAVGNPEAVGLDAPEPRLGQSVRLTVRSLSVMQKEALVTSSRTGKTCDDDLWRTLADQGLLGVALPEDCGGSGLGLIELCLVLEEQGRRVAPVPLFASLVLGGLPIAGFGSDAQRQRYLPALAGGERKFSAAIAEVGMNAALVEPVEATRSGDAWMPVTVQVGGERVVLEDRGRSQTVEVATAERPEAVVLDPDVVLLDTDRTNNRRDLGR